MIQMTKKLAVTDRKICVACGACMKVCPKAAVQIYRGCYALMDPRKCVGCGKCANTCPAGCIELKERGQ